MTNPQDDTGHAVLDGAAGDLLFRAARTASTFTDEPVGDEQVRAIHELVKWGPTSMNVQPLRVVLVRTPEARQRLVDQLMPGNKDKTSRAPLVAVLAADHGFDEHLPVVFPNAPWVGALFADQAVRDRTAEFNAGIQVGYFILGVRAVGLAAGPMSGFDADGINREFFPDGRHRVLAVVNIGRPGPDAWRERLPRLAYEQVVTSV
ncbi:nitroreductase [Actinokineospora spheciospongiae]|uniref:Nitroreductase n=1 Tax=Actinokineospora spheciospongiae TaxID=909613 RepID=W7JB78_9PSEU|nr:malonic semialdehyde reductase [Actinokineospora spheciospongiae]EWC63314.1 nitroreductase [Actinokineospora spheciospongiae]